MASGDLVFFKNAVHALRKDRFRKGDMVFLPKEGDIIFTGDIHGNINNLKKILRLADLKSNPKRHVVLHELVHNIYGHTEDRSYDCLVLAARAKKSYPDQVHIFAGNHELAELHGREIAKKGMKVPLVFGPESAGDPVSRACRQFIRNMPLALKTCTGIWFSHSTPEKALGRFSVQMLVDARPLQGTGTSKCSDKHVEEVIEDLLWGRDYSAHSCAEFAGKTECHLFIVGHEPCKGFSVPSKHHVILDSKDSNGAWCLLKLNRTYTQKGVVANIRSLKDS